MIRVVALFVALAALVGALAVPASSDNHTGQVDALVTPKLVAISVNPSSFDYGLVQLGTSVDAPPAPGESAGGPSIVITNDGSVAVDLSIAGSDTENVTTPAGPVWTLSDTSTGDDQYMHQFAINSGVSKNPMSTIPQLFISGVGSSGGTAELYLTLDLPLTSRTYDQQSAPVIITATES